MLVCVCDPINAMHGCREDHCAHTQLWDRVFSRLINWDLSNVDPLYIVFAAARAFSLSRLTATAPIQRNEPPAAEVQPTKEHERRLCDGLLPLQRKFRATLSNRSRPAYSAATSTAQGHEGVRGKSPFLIPPGAFAPLSARESGLRL